MAGTLIAFFSWNGGSAKLARNLYEAIDDSDIYHILTKKKYSGSFFGCVRQARKEFKTEERPELKYQLTGKQMLKYERIILIYPIWFGTCPMAVRSFLEGIKTDRLDIFPVGLSKKTGVEQSIRDIHKSAPKAAIAEGVRVPGKIAGEQSTLHQVMHYLGLE